MSVDLKPVAGKGYYAACSLFFVAVFVAGAPAAGEAPPFYEDKAEMTIYIDAKGRKHPVQTARDWQRRRADILANMQLKKGKGKDER